MGLLARLRHALGPDDRIDGCDAVLESSDAIADEDLAGFVLFADVKQKPKQIAKRKAEWEQLFGGS